MSPSNIFPIKVCSVYFLGCMVININAFFLNEAPLNVTSSFRNLLFHVTP